MLCFWARHFYSHGASLHKGVHMGTGEFNAGGNTVMDLHPIQGGVEILLVASCCTETGDKLWRDGPIGPYSHLTFLP